MCSNYRPVTRSDWMLGLFGIERSEDAVPADCWPTGLAPFIRLARSGQREVQTGHFGLLAHFATEVTAGRRTYNARSETAHIKPSFRDAWRKSRRCIVPVEYIFEPCWETGQAVRWKIGQPHGAPFGVAGLYNEWHPPGAAPGSPPVHSFTMLTCNGDAHPLMRRMHRPEDEKRMVIILDPSDYEGWLTCSPDEAHAYLRPWLGELVGESAPLMRGGKAGGTPAPSPDAPDLFG